MSKTSLVLFAVLLVLSFGPAGWAADEANATSGEAPVSAADVPEELTVETADKLNATVEYLKRRLAILELQQKIRKVEASIAPRSILDGPLPVGGEHPGDAAGEGHSLPSVVSIRGFDGRAQAVLRYGSGEYGTVAVGDSIPGGMKVTAISDRGVTVSTKNKASRTLGFVGTGGSGPAEKGGIVTGLPYPDSTRGKF